MAKNHYWWYAYGYFEAGKDNLPHFGQALAHYRKLSGWSKAQAASVLKCTERYIEMLESDQNTNMPKSNPRRAALAKILKIPPVLLGVAFVAPEENVAHAASGGAQAAFDSQTMTFYEDMLSACWELYYTSSVHGATKKY
jgi:transcriptional regulator with XRE-family HTH domain